MKLKYLISLISSFFVATSARSQTNPVKKETKPQVKSNTTIKTTTTTSNKAPGTVSEKHKSTTSLPITVKPDKQKGTTSLPITVKPDKQKGTTSLPITVKPGDVLYTTSFEKETTGNMPAGWKSNSIGEVKEIPGNGKWLKLGAGSKYESSFKQTLPSDFKVEFDFIANYDENMAVPELNMRVFKKGEEFREGGLTFLLGPSGGTNAEPGSIQVFTHEQGPAEIYRAEVKNITKFAEKNGKNQPVHTVVSVKGDHVQVWMDGEKMYDLQEVKMPGVKFDRLAFETGSYGGPKKDYDYMISNIRITAE